MIKKGNHPQMAKLFSRAWAGKGKMSGRTIQVGKIFSFTKIIWIIYWEEVLLCCLFRFKMKCPRCSFCHIPIIVPGWWFGTCLIFPYIRNNYPNWLSYFSDGLKPPTRWCFWYILSTRMAFLLAIFHAMPGPRCFFAIFPLPSGKLT